MKSYRHRSPRKVIWVIAILATFGLGLSATPPARAQAVLQVVNVLHSFTSSGGDGQNPVAGLIMDASNNLFGTTQNGGANGAGTVFELVNSSGNYSEKVLYSFTSNGGDGQNPLAGLIMDASGNLFGTTKIGGVNGAGTVFELVNSSGNYSEKVLYSFMNSGGDGGYPYGGVIMDASGNLFGTTGNGGVNGFGTVFELVNSSGNYSEKVLYSFAGSGGDGHNPLAGLIMDASGNLFGTTVAGGVNSFGTVFELVNSSGNYSEKVLYSFAGAVADGAYPYAGLVMDASGNLFGTTQQGGSGNGGIVFELVNSSGNYSGKVLHSFTSSEQYPLAGLIVDGSGNLFGTSGTNPFGGLGIVFELVNSSGTYTEKIVHSFPDAPCGVVDGHTPVAGLIMDASGDLFGTTQNGGADGTGTVYEIVKLSATPIATTTTVLTSPNPVPIYNGFSITATVTSSSTPPFPFPPLSGTVTFSTPSGSIGSGAIGGCGGNLTTSIGGNPESLGGIGTIPITAQFTPDVPDFAPSTATTSETVMDPGVVLTSGNNTLTGNQTINGNESVNGSISATSLTIGGGAPIGQYDSATFTIAIPSLASGSCTTQTRIWSAVGSGTNDTIALGVPDSFLSAGGAVFFQAWESAANTIKFRACNVDAHGPPSSSVTGSIRVDLIKH